MSQPALISKLSQARSRGSSFVSAPNLKRLSLAALSLKAARLPVISTSVLMYCRPLAFLLSTLFSFGVCFERGLSAQEKFFILRHNALWLGGDKKGAYAKLESVFRAALKTLDLALVCDAFEHKHPGRESKSFEEFE